MREVRLGVIGDPLAFTLSPELHRAGCAALGITCDSVAIRTPTAVIEERLAEFERREFLGVNVTHPLKADVLRFVPRVSDAARRARSANTLGFGEGGRWADTTDGAGFLDLLRGMGRDPASMRAVMLGAGGSARSLALALIEAGAPAPVVTARDPGKRAGAWVGVEASFVEWRSAGEARELERATLVINCTPLSAEEGPAPIDRLPRGALIVDLVYGPDVTRWVRAARRAGLEAIDGLGLLVHQARHSLKLWLGQDVPLAALEEAVGWPR